jgi:hypothetical protein
MWEYKFREHCYPVKDEPSKETKMEAKTSLFKE